MGSWGYIWQVFHSSPCSTQLVAYSIQYPVLLYQNSDSVCRPHGINCTDLSQSRCLVSPMSQWSEGLPQFWLMRSREIGYRLFWEIFHLDIRNNLQGSSAPLSCLGHCHVRMWCWQQEHHMGTCATWHDWGADQEVGKNPWPLWYPYISAPPWEQMPQTSVMCDN